jgi:AraC-like DNA-binding protein
MAHLIDVRTPPSRATVTRHASGLGSWELARAAPAEALRPLVRGYVGWSEQMAAPMLRRELPADEAPLIINFGAPFHLFAPGASRRDVSLASFVTGAYDTYQIVESAGMTSGVQINFTLLGLRAIVGRPIEDMTNRAFAPEDIFGGFARELTGRLHDLGCWDDRFDCLDSALTRRLRDSREVPAAVRFAWQQLKASSGRTPVGAIVREIGWSQRHFIARFRHELGVTPKVFARMMRFAQVVRHLRAGATADLADVALAAGYCDQSHLNRDAREFAGVSPGWLRRSLLPDEGGFAVDVETH